MGETKFIIHQVPVVGMPFDTSIRVRPNIKSLIIIYRYSRFIVRPTSRLPATNVAENIRAAFLVFGPLLARTGRAEVYKPGGCKIGERPVDFHIEAMEDMGAKLIKDDREKVFMAVEDGLKPGPITLKRSVGATETALMAASLVTGMFGFLYPYLHPLVLVNVQSTVILGR